MWLLKLYSTIMYKICLIIFKWIENDMKKHLIKQSKIIYKMDKRDNSNT